ncbi:MAG TPA: response regulator [Solirubrobacteraceae bacterium]|nr:response regulator [Solirubrobacteraceae bacterium]
MTETARTVLLVEDEPDVRFATRLVLEDAGYAVIEAREGQEAIERLETTKVDAMFLDLRLPGIDGWRVLEDLRARSGGSLPPVIILSAQADPSAVTRSVGLGAVAYVMKPFHAADLTQAVAAVLE